MEKYPCIYCPMRIIQIGLMPAEAKLLYGVILTDAVQKGYSSMSNRELNNGIGLSDTQVQNRLETFEQYGYITCEVIRDEKNNKIIERRIYPDKEDLKSLRKFIKEGR